MTTKMLRVKATRKFGYNRAGDELLVAENAETKLLVKHGYYELIAVEVEESKPDKPKAAKTVKPDKAEKADKPAEPKDE